MANYLKLFNNHLDYETYSSDMIRPNVSLCVNENEVHYNPYIPSIPAIGMVLVFANPECTEYSDGQSDDVWVRLNQAFGYGDRFEWNSSQDSKQFSVTAPSETHLDSYLLTLWVDWISELSEQGYTSGQVVKCTCPFGDCAINNPKVIFDKIVVTAIFETDDSPVKLYNIDNNLNVNGQNTFNKVEIDGILADIKYGLDYLDGIYEFLTYGEHTVKYTFKSDTEIPYDLFKNCVNLKSVVISCNDEISISDGVFWGCSGLLSVTMNNVTNIGISAFSGCSDLLQLVLPETISNIEYWVFAGTGLESMTIYATTPPTISNPSINIFDVEEGDTIPTIYVPAQSVNAYKLASGWSDYASNIQAIP